MIVTTIPKGKLIYQRIGTEFHRPMTGSGMIKWFAPLSGFAASPLINPPLENSQIFVFRLKI